MKKLLEKISAMLKWLACPPSFKSWHEEAVAVREAKKPRI